MALSYSESAVLTCPTCSQDFASEVWLVLDAQEHPELVAELKEGRLNLVACPHCGASGPAGAPLLFHDGVTRQVIFAAAPGAADHEWGEQARELHALLVGSIALEDRRSYLSDVQVAQDLAGIAHRLNKQARRPQAPGAPPTAPVTAETIPVTGDAETPPLLVAVQALLAAGSEAELGTVVATHPLLLDADIDAVLYELAGVALEQREHEIAESLQQARRLTTELRARYSGAGPAIAAEVDAALAPADLPASVYEDLLQAQTAEQLAALVRRYPALSGPDAQDELARRVDAALDEGNERLAHLLEARREALTELALPADATAELATAIEALLTAETDDALAQVLDSYPLLFSDAAQEALWEFAAAARSGGDDEMATYAIECRALLRKVREGLDE